MSPRAAWRLETLGYDAYDYVPGKTDWLAFGLPFEGSAQLVGAQVTDLPTSALDDRLGAVRDRLEASRFGLLAVVNAEGVVLGRLNAAALDEADDTPVSSLMYEGPTTARPSEQLEAIVGRMQKADVDGVIITRLDGVLLGILERRVGEQALEEPHDAHG